MKSFPAYSKKNCQILSCLFVVWFQSDENSFTQLNGSAMKQKTKKNIKHLLLPGNAMLVPTCATKSFAKCFISLSFMSLSLCSDEVCEAGWVICFDARSFSAKWLPIYLYDRGLMFLNQLYWFGDLDLCCWYWIWLNFICELNCSREINHEFVLCFIMY